MPELKDLLKELYCKAADKWEDIGILVDVDQGKLNSIKSSHGNQSEACLREMLKIWVTQVDPSPSWIILIEALENLGCRDLAKDLKHKYITKHT